MVNAEQKIKDLEQKAQRSRAEFLAKTKEEREIEVKKLIEELF